MCEEEKKASDVQLDKAGELIKHAHLFRWIVHIE